MRLGETRADKGRLEETKETMGDHALQTLGDHGRTCEIRGDQEYHWKLLRQGRIWETTDKRETKERQGERQRETKERQGERQRETKERQGET